MVKRSSHKVFILKFVVRVHIASPIYECKSVVDYETPNLETGVRFLSLVPALNLRFLPIPLTSGALYDLLAQLVKLHGVG